jgi:hypothetical protein
MSSRGSSRNEVLADFWVWNWFTGSRAAVHGEYEEAGLYPEIRIERSYTAASYPITGASSTHIPDNYGANYFRLSVPSGASGPFSFVFDGDNSAIWSAQLVLIGSATYSVRTISLNSYGYGTITLEESEYAGLENIVLIAGVLSNSGNDLPFVFNAAFEEITHTYEPARNLVATSGQSGRVPLAWNPPEGSGVGGFNRDLLC